MENARTNALQALKDSPRFKKTGGDKCNSSASNFKPLKADTIHMIPGMSRGKLGGETPLWKVKQDRPEFFEVRANTAPTGFVEHSDGWYCNEAEDMVWNEEANLFFGFDLAAGEYYQIHEGSNYEDVVTVSVGGSATSQTAGKRVIIPDLQKVAVALEKKLGHIDRPTSMFAVFGGSEVEATCAARNLHVLLLQRLATYRGHWSQSRVRHALAESIDELRQGGQNGVSIAAALMSGDRLYLAASEGVKCVVCVASSDACAADSDSHISCCQGTVGNGTSTRVEEEISAQPRCVALLSHSDPPLFPDKVVAGALSAHMQMGRVHAGAVAVAEEARKLGHPGLQVVVGSLRPKASTEVLPAKRQKVEASSQVRIRHILLRHTRSKVQVATDPVRKRPVNRSMEEAEVTLLGILTEALRRGETCPASKKEREVANLFTMRCKDISECASALKGGDFAGDLGWIAKQEKSIPSALVKAAFELKAGQLSDIVDSELGMHLLVRTA